MNQYSVADDFPDLGEQMMEYHFQSACQVCDETFITKDKLTYHMSEDHEIEEKVKDFSSDKIKFKHCEKKFYFFEEFNDAQNNRTYRTDKYMLGFYSRILSIW